MCAAVIGMKIQRKSARSLIWSSIIVAALGCLAGCASSDKWSHVLPETITASKAEKHQDIKNKPLRVVALRWPAIIDVAARPLLVANYRRFIEESTSYDTPVASLAGFSEFLESSSTFYAAELYWAIRRSDPSVVVLLEPHIVREGVGQNLVSQPLLEAGSMTDVAAHLWVYSAPLSPSAPLVVSVMTFGLTTAPLRSPKNCGFLLVTVDTEPLAGEVEAASCNRAAFIQSSHWLLDGGQRKGTFIEDLRTTTLPLSPLKTVVAPMLVEGKNGPFSATPSDYVVRSRPQRPQDAETTMLNPFIENYAKISVAGLDIVEPADDRLLHLEPYIREFDQVLANKVASSNSLSNAEKKNLALVNRIRSQELQVRMRRDEAVAREMLTGRFGRAFRQARDEAYASYGSTMSKMWLSTATALVTGSAALQSANSGAAVLAANNSAYDMFNQDIERSGLELVRRLAPSMQSLGKMSLNLLDESVSVAIGDQASLRTALRAIYIKYRSSD